MVRETAPRRSRRLPDEPQIPNEEIRYAVSESVLGPVLAAWSDKGVVSIQLGHDPEQLLRSVQRQLPRGHLVRADNKALLKRVIRYIDEPEGVLDVELDIRGTEFQKKVFAAIREVPAGETASYSDIAYKTGAPRAGRAVGSVCATNNLAFAVPCHRVLHKDGTPRTGPHWGHTQLSLLRREGSAPMGKGK
jgi:AraC family transcriptional regulator, regulatory protein of adaptative response / methylated-DNA-[protein]-cysteine methyltransferase